MRVLLDECVPRPFRRELVPHDVRTIQEMGWKGFKNGKLLAAMSAAGFETLITVDQNMQFQQNIGSAGVGVVLMIAPTNRLDDLLPLAPDVLGVSWFSVNGKNVAGGLDIGIGLRVSRGHCTHF